MPYSASNRSCALCSNPVPRFDVHTSAPFSLPSFHSHPAQRALHCEHNMVFLHPSYEAPVTMRIPIIHKCFLQNRFDVIFCLESTGFLIKILNVLLLLLIMVELFWPTYDHTQSQNSGIYICTILTNQSSQTITVS